MQPDSNRSTKFQFKIKLTFDSVQIRFIGKSSGKLKLAQCTPNHTHTQTYVWQIFHGMQSNEIQHYDFSHLIRLYSQQHRQALCVIKTAI